MQLSAIRPFAISLPEVSEEPHHDFGSFRVRGKIFTTLPPGGEFIHLFVPDDIRDQALTLYPAFAEKLLWGGKVMGLRLQLAHAEAPAVQWLLEQAWYFKAPKRLAAARRSEAGQAAAD